jgi:hypothetical protein
MAYACGFRDWTQFSKHFPIGTATRPAPSPLATRATDRLVRAHAVDRAQQAHDGRGVLI